MSENTQTVKIESFFPVYDTLFKQISNCSDKDSPVSLQEIGTIASLIKQLDSLGQQMIYVFVRIHSLRNSDTKLLEIPYTGQKVSQTMDNNQFYSDVKFDLRNFPTVLLRMLHRFASLHLRRMNEEKLKTAK